jgi:hypothetical protein
MLKEQIKKLLISKPKTRNSDTELWLQYLWENAEVFSHNNEICISFNELKKFGIGKDSIRRCRQNLQVEYPELKADKEVQKYRKIKEKEMINIYGSNPAYLPPLEHYTNMF